MKLYEEMVELKNLKKKYNTVKAGLYSSEERWKKAKRYQRFLIYISPLHWKKEHADQVKEYDLSVRGINKNKQNNNINYSFLFHIRKNSLQLKKKRCSMKQLMKQ